MLARQNNTGALLAVVLALGCASAGADKSMHEDHLPGRWHIVAAGETSGSLAEQGGIPLEDFLEINGLKRGEALAPGRPVFVLGKTAVPSANASAQSAAPPVAPTQVGTSSPPGKSNAPLRWPVASPRLSSLFGTRWGKPHEGIDMAAPTGTPVLAASAGEVIYAGDQVRGYGNMVVLKHASELVTVYAHNSLLLVHTGDRVAVGQEIARVGDTGRSTAPHLHFEVRRGEIPQDPIPLLPALK
jgi:murein DD-endopeptidase MepM/ murein hydrolase activator NlpD